MHDLEERKIGFRSLTDNIDTTTASGRMFFHMMGALGPTYNPRISPVGMCTAGNFPCGPNH